MGLDGEPEGDPVPDGLQLEALRVLAGEELVDRPLPEVVEGPHGHQPVSGAQPGLPDADALQILRPQFPVVGADFGVGHQNQIPRLQAAGGVGVLAVVIQAKAVFGLLVDVGDDPLPADSFPYSAGPPLFY